MATPILSQHDPIADQLRAHFGIYEVCLAHVAVYLHDERAMSWTRARAKAHRVLDVNPARWAAVKAERKQSDDEVAALITAVRLDEPMTEAEHAMYDLACRAHAAGDAAVATTLSDRT